MFKEVLAYLILLILFLGFVFYSTESKASVATGSFTIRISVQLMCPIDGIVVPVDNKQDCLDLQSGKTKYYQISYDNYTEVHIY